MKEKFVKILTDADLWGWFLSYFCEDWEAKDWHLEGWWFDDDSISYRICDLFDDHADGYNWNFWNGDAMCTILHFVLKSHGFKETHNGGDEEDGYYRMELKKEEAKPIKQKTESQLPF